MLAVDPTWAVPVPAAPGKLLAVGGDGDGTTYLATADSDGNLVSATPSSFGALAQGMVLGDTGILANCRGCYFWLDENNPNGLAPRKRPRTTPCTFIILKDGQPFMTLGTPGGDSQPQSNLQTLCNIIDFGMNVQEAVEAPRFCGYSFPQSPWPHEEFPNLLEIEESGRAGRGGRSQRPGPPGQGHRSLGCQQWIYAHPRQPVPTEFTTAAPTPARNP